MVADEEKMDHPSVDHPNRVAPLDSKSNTFVAPKERRHHRQSLGLASMRNRSKDDYCDVVVGRRLSSFSAAPLQRCQSDVKVTMRPQKAINRNGTIARNQFRGIRRDVLESQTQHIIRSMTVSILPKCKSCEINFWTNSVHSDFANNQLYNGFEIRVTHFISFSVVYDCQC